MLHFFCLKRNAEMVKASSKKKKEKWLKKLFYFIFFIRVKKVLRGCVYARNHNEFYRILPKIYDADFTPGFNRCIKLVVLSYTSLIVVTLKKTSTCESKFVTWIETVCKCLNGNTDLSQQAKIVRINNTITREFNAKIVENYLFG